MVWWRRSDKDPTTDGDASSVFSLDSGSLSAADTSLAESSSGRSSGGDAPGPALNAPPAPSATSMCRLTPDVVTAFEHGLDMPVAALEQSCPVSLEAGCPDVVLLQHMLSRNTSTPPALSSLRSAQRELDDWLIRWADAARFDELFERRRFIFVGDREPRGEMTAFEMLVHIVNHTTYHRGWAVQMMMEPGKTAPATTTDLPVYCRDVGRVPA